MAYDRDLRDTPATDSLGINNPGTNPRAEQILPGTPIFDAMGEKIGAVDDLGFQDGVLRVRQIGVLSRDMAIPLDAIARTDAGGVHLTATKDQLRRMSDSSAEKTDAADSSAQPMRKAQTRPNDMATDTGSPHADLDVPPPHER